MDDQTHSLGWVHLFETGSDVEIAKGAVTISATAHIDALREAIIRKGFSKLKDRTFDELVVKPTRDGAPLDPATRLWRVKFEQDADKELHAYVDVAPSPSTGEDLTLVQMVKVCSGSKRKFDGALMFEMLQTHSLTPKSIAVTSPNQSSAWPQKHYRSRRCRNWVRKGLRVPGKTALSRTHPKMRC